MRLVTLTLIGLLSALLVSCSGGSDDDSDPRTSTPTSSAKASRTATSTPDASDEPTPSEEAEFPDLTSFSADIEARLHGIRDKVAEIRGLPIHPTAQEGLTTKDALAAYGQDQFASLGDEDAAEAEAGEAALQLMGLIPVDYSFDDYVSEQANVIAGVYYPQADRLVLVGDNPDDLSVSEELTIAHEYLHSLQDARWDIETLSDKWMESDEEEQGLTSYGETLSCLIEGDAEVLQRLYAEEVYGEDWEDIVAEESADDEPIEFDIPDFLLNGFYFNYSDCVTFVETLYDRGGWDAVNAAYDNPPGTTEQILDITKYDSGEWAGEPKPEDLAVEGWSEATSGQFGQYDIFNWVGSRTDNYIGGYMAAMGWRSGWIRVFRETDGSTVVEVTLTWDEQDEQETFLEAFDEVLESHDVSSSEVEEVDGVDRWVTEDEIEHHGALISDDAGARVTILYGEDDAAVDKFLAAY